MARVARVDLPQRSALKPLYAKAGFADAFAIDLPSNATGDAERLAAHMLMGQARWVGWLERFPLDMGHKVYPACRK